MDRVLVLLLSGIALGDWALASPAHKFAIDNGISEQDLKHTFQSLVVGGRLDHDLTILTGNYQRAADVSVLCTVCTMTASKIIQLHRNGATYETIHNTIVDMCVSMNIAQPHICSGMVDMNLPTLLHIISERPLLNEHTICGTVFQSNLCRLDDNDGTLDWTIDIDDAPFATQSKRMDSTNRWSSDEPLTIVQITDTHSDPLYVAGSLAECNEPVCCRQSVGTANSTDREAGRWGDYRNCDSPWEATLNVFAQIKANHKKIDYIYYTGDAVDHAIWQTSSLANAETINRTFDALRAVFGDIPVLPVIGNHEPHPVNFFAPDYKNHTDFETASMYNQLADNWAGWLPESALTTVRRSGYYTVLLRPGLRLIGLNNNDGSTYNLWLLYDSAYTARQLQWLHDTLLDAERNGEKVHILVHFPNNHADMHRTYSREYQRIVERFWDTISAQFNGHTHKDQFYVFFDRETSTHALNVAWNGGSATSYSNVNPNYRVYTVEPATFQVVEHDTWIYNLTEANQNTHETPRWFHEYSFRSAFDVADLSPASLDQLFTLFSHDPDALEQYWRFKVKQGDPWLAIGCDRYCLASELCTLATSQTEPGQQNARCQQLLAQLSETLWWSQM